MSEGVEEREGGGGGGGRNERIQNHKQKPHTSMWGKTDAVRTHDAKTRARDPTT